MSYVTGICYQCYNSKPVHAPMEVCADEGGKTGI